MHTRIAPTTARNVLKNSKMKRKENAMYKWKSKTMGNIVETFGEVILQAWDSLIHYHTLDIKWEYNKNGF
jgi:hypothetical protein